MINQESKLKLQAYLDNELSSVESRQMTAWLDQDAAALALYTALRDVKLVLARNELEVTLPESRELYWSRIERAIQLKPGGSRGFLPGYPWWVRFLSPALGSAMLVIAALCLVKLGTGPANVTYLHEIETPLEGTSAISFHSQSAGMTVVWVQNQ